MPVSAPNLVVGSGPRDFWVWVNPSNVFVRHQITVTGCFISAGTIGDRKSNLPFLPNPDFSGDISPFSIGVMRDYTVEFNLEKNREHFFASYPSRLNAIFLLGSEIEASKYAERHPDHTRGRVLKRVRSCGAYCYSTHDSSWIDFLRLPHSCDDQTIHNITQSYWRGEPVEQCAPRSMGKSWQASPILETLYLGRVDFYDRLFSSECS